MNRSRPMVFNSDCLENVTENQSKPGKTRIYGLASWNSNLSGKANFTSYPPPVWIQNGRTQDSAKQGVSKMPCIYLTVEGERFCQSLAFCNVLILRSLT